MIVILLEGDRWFISIMSIAGTWLDSCY
jgi:hypothetical protein